MSEASPANTHARFYADQGGPLNELRRYTQAIPAVLFIVLVGILVGLRSPWYVWVYIIALYGVALWGFARLRQALARTSAAVLHLEQTAIALENSPARDDFIAFLRENASPTDLSNVPEAILTLASGQMSGESIRVAANTSFTHPTSELNFAAYVRTTMVLGGLFGTVLFFAFELGGTAFLEGNLNELLPGLRGALASTLTGILGSLSLGLVASRIEHQLAQLVWETEAFLSGPVISALATVPQKRALRTEVDLWESLRQEVAEMTNATTKAYVGMSNDIHGHARSLEELSRQIGELPAVQIPQELARLAPAIDQFTHGTDVLAKTSRVLVEAVGALGVFAPARLLTDVEQLATASAQRETALANGMSALAARVSALGSQMDDIHQRVGVPERLWESLADLEMATRRNAEQIARLAEEVRARQDVGAVTDAVQQAVASVQSLEGGLATFRGEVSAEVDRLASASSGLETSAAGVRSAADQLSGLTATVAKAAPELQKQAARLADTIDRAQQQEKTLQRVESRLGPLESVYEWHERTRRAPLMRLLTLPLWPGRSKEPEPPVRIVRRETGAAAPAAAAAPPPGRTSAPAGSLDVAPQLYRRWCLDGTPPRIPDALEVAALRYAGDENPDEPASPVHTFREGSQGADFVRFSPRGGDVGMAFPSPLGKLEEAKRQILFPDVPAAAFQDPQQLASVRPIHIQRRADGAWVKA